MINQPVLIITHPEEVVFLCQALYFSTTGGAVSICQVLLCPEAFFRHAVPTFVFVLVDFIRIFQLLQNFLHLVLVSRFGSSDEIVIADVQLFPDGLIAFDHLIAMFLRCFPAICRCLCHLLSMLVCTSQEEHIMTKEPMITS